MSGLDIFALIVLIVLIVAAVVIWFLLAMLPGQIAKKRNHPQAEAINIGGWLGALMGGVFWPIVLVWAFTKPGVLTSETTGPSRDEVEELKNKISILEAKLQEIK